MSRSHFRNTLLLATDPSVGSTATSSTNRESLCTTYSPSAPSSRISKCANISTSANECMDLIIIIIADCNSY